MSSVPVEGRPPRTARLRTRLQGLSLRARVVAVLVALVLVGLTVFSAATNAVLSRNLVSRVDAELAADHDAMVGVVASATTGGPRFAFGGAFPPGTYGALRLGDTNAASPVVISNERNDQRQPALPAHVPLNTPITVRGGTTGSPHYRVLATPADPRDAARAPFAFDTVIVAIPLSDVYRTLHELLLIEVLAGLVVLVALGSLAWWLVGVGMRPLRDIERTAGAIASGDLAQRVPEAPVTTEVGRLGRSLNAMLAQIERAFSARLASEERLRRTLADASHELRTPLTSIRGYAELFRRGAGSKPEDLAKAMRRIEDEAARMGLLVDDLLLLARLDEQRPLAQDPVDLAAIARDAADDLRVADPGRPVDVDAPDAVMVRGDEHRLRQVLSNLLANARVHTPPGTPVHVRVSARMDAAPGEAPALEPLGVVEVSDEGPGLPDGSAERVFERFYRADPARARLTGGTGLGLAVVAAVAAAHGGRAGASDRPGGGASFRVELPLDAGVREQLPAN